MNIKRFAALLKQKRTTLNLSQSKVAELCYLSKSTYNHYEHGMRLPTLETLLRLSVVLKTDLNEFIYAIYSEYNIGETNITPSVIREDVPVDSKYQNNFASTFRLLDQQEQKAIVDIMDSIISTNSNNIK